MMGALPARLFALLMAAVLALAAFYYPLNKLLLVPALAAYAALLWWRPTWWLLLVPALLPVLDLAPWTGWFYLEEFDLLLLASAAVGYWRLAPQAPQAALPPFVVFALWMSALATAIAAGIGLLPLPPLDANAFANYSSHYNSLRVAKGLLWALLLLPLLRRSAGADLVNLRRLFVPGMLIGLAFTALAVVWERSLFPGLFNFSSDYRPTAPFSAMHTGGAALDAYLAVAFPFVTLWLIGSTSHRQLGVALVLLVMGFFTGFTTFSRDVYLAYASSGAIIVLLVLGHRLRRGALGMGQLGGAALLLLGAAAVLMRVFASSGYRGLLAALVLLGAAVVLAGAAPRLRHWLLFGATALGLVLLDLTLFFGLRDAFGGVGKGPYLGLVLGVIAFGAAAAMLWLGPPNKQPQALAIAAGALISLALSTGLVAVHWGGEQAGFDAGWAALLAGALVAGNRLPLKPLWQLNRNTLTVACFSAIVFVTVIPIAASYYLGSRFSTAGSDFDVRLRHWDEALEMMTPDWSTRSFGMGLGRYPDTYFWHNTRGEMPGTFSYGREAQGNQFLRLASPHHAIGFGEVLRTLQRVAIEPGMRYRLSFDLRRSQPSGWLQLGLCERWLLYAQNCLPLELPQAKPGTGWQHVELDVDSGRLGGGGLFGAPIQLELASEGKNAVVEVDNLSLRSASGAELVRNGGFEDGNNYWFFSSDHDHMPWHVKNFFVNTYFEQGIFGSIAMALLLLYAAGNLAARGWDGELDASVYLAALAGVLIVGMFDSLFDVPRLTLLFYMLLAVALLQPVRAPVARPARRRRRRIEEGSETVTG
ncbi:MAG: hypothetical protein V4724_31215 [Pseudomonadota bacterium]